MERETEGYSTGLLHLLPLFPPRFRGPLQEAARRFSVEQIQLRKGRPVLFRFGGNSRLLAGGDLSLTDSEFEGIFQGLMQGSLHAKEDLLKKGCLLYPGGYRIGVAGRAAVRDGEILALSRVDSLLLRIPKRHPGIAAPLADYFYRRLRTGGYSKGQGLLLCAPPGEGKTTVLRDLAELLSSPPYSLHTVVLDEREELFFGNPPDALPPSSDLDVLASFPKSAGLEAAIRCLSPQLLLCDELGDPGELKALWEMGSGGVPFIATAHGRSAADVQKRPGIEQLFRAGFFFACVTLRRLVDNRMQFQFESWEDA